MRVRQFLPLLACLALAGCANAAVPDLPSFAHLRDKAVESVDITVGSLPLFLARHLLSDDDPDSAKTKKMMMGVKAVQVKNYRFDSEGVYSRADIDSVRSKFTGPGWSRLAQVHDRKSGEDVDVFVAIDHDKITQLAVVAAKPREFTIVHVEGDIDPSQFDELKSQLHLPVPSMERSSQNVQ
jgi:hypothetical protein